MNSGSKETLTEQMDKFCETFEQDEVGKKCDDSNKNDITKGEQLSSLLKEIQEKESELNSLRLKYENLKKMGNCTLIYFLKLRLNIDFSHI